MRPPIPTTGDSWHSVTDPKERKRIQDRLAQRARRRRLAGGTASDNLYSGGTTTSDASPSGSLSSVSSTEGQISNANLQPNAPFGISQSVFSAMFINGQLLGLKCGAAVPAKSLTPGDQVPSTLRPTLLQLGAVHFTWIDRYPFEDCRDELIIQAGNYDEEEYLYDLFNMPSFHIDSACASWDPQGWRMEKAWEEKWGWLFPSCTRA